MAVVDGQYEKASRLISRGADANATGFLDFSGTTALIIAAKRGDTRMVDLLLTNKANVNMTDKYGDSPLSSAIEGRHSTIVETLIAHGADVNGTQRPWATPLMNAILLGDTKIVKILLDHGADVNKRDPIGRTALEQAKGHNRPEIEKLLVKYGAGREQPPVQACDYKGAKDAIDAYQSGGKINYIKGKDVYVSEKWLVSDFEHKKTINRVVICFLTKGTMDFVTVYYRNNYTGRVMATGTPSEFEM